CALPISAARLADTPSPLRAVVAFSRADRLTRRELPQGWGRFAQPLPRILAIDQTGSRWPASTRSRRDKAQSLAGGELPFRNRRALRETGVFRPARGRPDPRQPHRKGQ